MKIGEHDVKLTSQDKVLFPKRDLTKGDLVDYYRKVAEVILPHLKDRAVTLQRFPSGIGKQGFFQKQAGGSSASAIGLVVVLWGAFKIFRGLDVAFSEIYETEAMNGFVDTLKDGAVVFVALVLAALATIAASAAFSVFSGVFPYVGVLAPLILVAGLVLAFLPMYYVFPDVEQHWRDTLPGVVFAAVGWAVFQALFQVYLLFKGGGASGLFGGVILVVTWLYFSGLVLLVGALINAVLNDHVTRTTDPSNAATTREETLRGDDIAMVFQDPMSSLNPSLTVGEQIAEAVEVQRRASANPRSTRSRTQGYGLGSLIADTLVPTRDFVSAASMDRAVELLEQRHVDRPAAAAAAPAPGGRVRRSARLTDACPAVKPSAICARSCLAAVVDRCGAAGQHQYAHARSEIKVPVTCRPARTRPRPNRSRNSRKAPPPRCSCCNRAWACASWAWIGSVAALTVCSICWLVKPCGTPPARGCRGCGAGAGAAGCC